MSLPFIDPKLLPGGSLCSRNNTGFDLNELPIDCDQEFWGFIQTMLLFGTYAFVLFTASNMISDGNLINLKDDKKLLIKSILF